MTGTLGKRFGPRLLALLAAAAVASGCPAQPRVEPVPCAPVQGALSAGARSDSLAGDYRLTLVATRGPRSGRSATAMLRLSRLDRPAVDANGARTVLRGSSTLVPDSVGAVTPGDAGSADAARPGVRVIEWQQRDGSSAAPRTQIALRFGADADGDGPSRFDGAYLALFVDSLGGGRFAGHWTSGAAEQRASGHFCAERVQTRM